MANATNAQVSRYVNERVRPSCEQIISLLNSLKEHKSLIDDVYANLTDAGVDWTDDRTDAPPHLLTPNDVLAWNTFVSNLITAIEGDAQLPIIQKAVVRTLS